MEEPKKEELETTAPAKEGDPSPAETGSTAKKEEEQAPAGLPNRSYILMLLAGIYLIYNGYRLCKNVLDGVEGASMGFMLAGIAFIAIGVGMLFVGGRGITRAEKQKKAQEAAMQAAAGSSAASTAQPGEDVEKTSAEGQTAAKEQTAPTAAGEAAAAQEAPGEASASQETAPAGKPEGKMSIAQRARLAQRLAEEEEETPGNET